MEGEDEGHRDGINAPNEEETFLSSPFIRNQSPCRRLGIRHRFIGNQASLILLLMAWLHGLFVYLFIVIGWQLGKGTGTKGLLASWHSVSEMLKSCMH